jgi:predicted nucleic acid-binding protein
VKRIVLDASAVMTFFENRSGADKVEELITLAVAGKRELFMSVVNWGEVFYSVWRAHGQQAAAKVASEVGQLPIEVVNADLELTRVAASFRAEHKLPYADCFAVGLAQLKKAEVLTSDRDFLAVGHRVNIAMI